MSRRNDEKVLVSADSMGVLGQDTREKSDTVKYFSNDIHGVHARPEVLDEQHKKLRFD